MDESRRKKNDEFYTQIKDVEDEVEHYWKHLKAKTIYCNCDDPSESAFYKYFHQRHKSIGYKRLIATCYKNPSYDLFTDNKSESGKYVIFDGKEKQQGNLKGSGSFRSDECIELLKESDVVITNPPFSKFRDYIAQLIKFEKKFLVIGNMNAVGYKEIFPLMKDNKIWWGITPRGHDFILPDGSMKNTNAVFYTNLDYPKLHEEIPLIEKYQPEKYPKYDNYDAIEVSKTKLTPYDYDGVMGVPISFLDKYCPEQFEIVGFRKGDDGKDLKVNGVEKYIRILIKRK